MKAGLIAGLVQKCLSYPLDLLTVRIALGVNTTTLGDKSYDVSEIAKSMRGSDMKQ